MTFFEIAGAVSAILVGVCAVVLLYKRRRDAIVVHTTTYKHSDQLVLTPEEAIELQKKLADQLRKEGITVDCDVLQIPHHGAAPAPPPSLPRVVGLLEGFKWFCGRDDREMVAVIQDDLKRDVAQMRCEGRREAFIRIVLLKHILFGAIIPICWDGATKALSKVVDAAELLKRLKF